MKSRSSTGVGQKIDLDYNIETMRITDPGIEESDSFRGGPKPSIMEAIKAKSTTSTSTTETGNESQQSTKWERATGIPAWEKLPATPDSAGISADVQSAKLKQLLGKIKTG
jgi:hypothetical protein